MEKNINFAMDIDTRVSRVSRLFNDNGGIMHAFGYDKDGYPDYWDPEKGKVRNMCKEQYERSIDASDSGLYQYAGFVYPPGIKTGNGTLTVKRDKKTGKIISVESVSVPEMIKDYYEKAETKANK